MNIKHLNQMLLAFVMSTAALGIGVSANAQDKPQTKQHKEEKDKKDDDSKAAQKQAHRDNTQEKQAEQRRIDDQQRNTYAEQANKSQTKPPKNKPQQKRLPPEKQKVLIQQQQRQVLQYRLNVDQQQSKAKLHAQQLQQQKRIFQYRYQQQYYERVRLQQLNYRNHSHDYYNDPYYYTASNYRYNYGGNYYQTNQYGANILRQALNYGYQEGIRAGRADHQDHWRYSYRDSYIYEDANYGYKGYYVRQSDYNYYFRQGFQRGYDDGYYSRYHYGQYNNGSNTLLSTLLVSILNLQNIN